MTRAYVACARHWDAMCDQIQAQWSTHHMGAIIFAGVALVFAIGILLGRRHPGVEGEIT